MSKAKNTMKESTPIHLDCAKCYAQGLIDGERRLARALKRWINKEFGVESYPYISTGEMFSWLTARLKRLKK